MGKVIFQTYPHFYKRMTYFIEENAKVNSCDVCFLGDSLTEMMDVTSFDGLKCINRGIVSDKSAGVLATLDDRVIAINPKTIFLLIGSNDICDGYTIKEIENNIKNIISYTKEKLCNVKFIVGTILPPCYYNAAHVDMIYPNCRDILRIKALNELIMNLKDVNNNIDVLDTYSILADKNDSLLPEDTLDGVHLTITAYNKLKEKIKEKL